MLHAAQSAYQKALEYRTPSTAPVSYATTLDNLGMTKISLARFENRRQLLREAVQHLETALSYCSVDADRVEFRRICHNLVDALDALASIENHIGNTLKRIEVRQKRNESFSPEITPRDHANSRKFQAYAYIDLAKYQLAEGSDKDVISQSLVEAMKILAEVGQVIKPGIDGYQSLQKIWGRYYTILAQSQAEAGPRRDNLQKALAIFQGMEDSTKEDEMDDGAVYWYWGDAWYAIAMLDAEDPAKAQQEFDQALDGYNKALGIYTLDENPTNNARVKLAAAIAAKSSNHTDIALRYLSEAEPFLRALDRPNDADECLRLIGELRPSAS